MSFTTISRNFQATLAYGLALLLLTVSTLDIHAKSPNIVVIMCDDVGYSDLGCYGSEINTPISMHWPLVDCSSRNFIIRLVVARRAAALLTVIVCSSSRHRTHGRWCWSQVGFPAYAGELSHNAMTIAECEDSQLSNVHDW